MNLLQALETLNALPDGASICITLTNYDYGVTLFYDDGIAPDEIGYGLDEVGSDIDGLIERIVAARDTAVKCCTPEVSQERLDLANAEADEMLHRLNDR